jgi:hypothetical protein
MLPASTTSRHLLRPTLVHSGAQLPPLSRPQQGRVACVALKPASVPAGRLPFLASDACVHADHLLRVHPLNPFELIAESEPPDGEFAVPDVSLFWMISDGRPSKPGVAGSVLDAHQFETLLTVL